MRKILIILTGGTICMVKRENGSLAVADETSFREWVPEIYRLDVSVEIQSLPRLIDSSDVNIEDWKYIAGLIYDRYDFFDGFVILHGTDTMSYTASAISFMLEGNRKPIVFTGSQLPIGVLRTDARENLLTAIEIVSSDTAQRYLCEVCIFFEGRLFRANRTTKGNSEHFAAFESYNYPPLAQVGVHIRYFEENMLKIDKEKILTLHKDLDNNVGILKIFPGIAPVFVSQMLNIKGLRALVLETFGAGNAPSYGWLYEELKNAIDRGVVIVNKTQCNTGSVDMDIYAVSKNLLRAGVLSGYDITTEALIAKLMHLLGIYKYDVDKIRKKVVESLCGEMTIVN